MDPHAGNLAPQRSNRPKQLYLLSPFKRQICLGSLPIHNHIWRLALATNSNGLHTSKSAYKYLSFGASNPASREMVTGSHHQGKARSRKFGPLLPVNYRRRRRRERRRPWPRRTRRRRPSVRRSRRRPRPLHMPGPAPAGWQSSAGSPFLSFCLCFNSSFFFAVPSSAFPTHIYLDREHQFQSSRAGEIEHMFFVKRLEWLGAWPQSWWIHLWTYSLEAKGRKQVHLCLC